MTTQHDVDFLVLAANNDDGDEIWYRRKLELPFQPHEGLRIQLASDLEPLQLFQIEHLSFNLATGAWKAELDLAEAPVWSQVPLRRLDQLLTRAGFVKVAE